MGQAEPAIFSLTFGHAERGAAWKMMRDNVGQLPSDLKFAAIVERDCIG